MSAPAAAAAVLSGLLLLLWPPQSSIAAALAGAAAAASSIMLGSSDAARRSRASRGGWGKAPGRPEQEGYRQHRADATHEEEQQISTGSIRAQHRQDRQKNSRGSIGPSTGQHRAGQYRGHTETGAAQGRDYVLWEQGSKGQEAAREQHRTGLLWCFVVCSLARNLDRSSSEQL